MDRDAKPRVLTALRRHLDRLLAWARRGKVYSIGGCVAALLYSPRREAWGVSRPSRNAHTFREGRYRGLCVTGSHGPRVSDQDTPRTAAGHRGTRKMPAARRHTPSDEGVPVEATSTFSGSRLPRRKFYPNLGPETTHPGVKKAGIQGNFTSDTAHHVGADGDTSARHADGPAVPPEMHHRMPLFARKRGSAGGR